MSILTLKPLNCTPEFYSELCSIFPVKVIKPDDSINSVMYNAGQQSVLDYIKGLLAGTEISSDLKKTIKPGTYTNRKVKR